MPELSSIILSTQATEVSGLTEMILWLGTAAMFIGMAAFLYEGNRRGKHKEFFVITIFITAIAGLNYLAMALGFGRITLTLGDGSSINVFWARYSDWILTTPLLILDLALLAKVDKETIGSLVGLDVLMILTGLVATLTAAIQERIIWWGISSALLIVLLYYLSNALTADNEVSQLVGKLKYILVGLWLVYPVVWMLGTEGLGLLPLVVETAGYAVLDVTAKVGFGAILLWGIRDRND